MKKWLVIPIVFVLIFVVGMFAGCITDSANQIDGTLHNNTDYKAYVYFRNKATGASWNWEVTANNTRSGTIDMGTYSLTARYSSNDEYIDSVEMIIGASHSTFTIIIYNTTLYARSY